MSSSESARIRQYAESFTPSEDEIRRGHVHHQSSPSPPPVEVRSLTRPLRLPESDEERELSDAVTSGGGRAAISSEDEEFVGREVAVPRPPRSFCRGCGNADVRGERCNLCRSLRRTSRLTQELARGLDGRARSVLVLLLEALRGILEYLLSTQPGSSFRDSDLA